MDNSGAGGQRERERERQKGGGKGAVRKKSGRRRRGDFIAIGRSTRGQG